MEWISVEDRLPKYQTNVLLWSGNFVFTGLITPEDPEELYAIWDQVNDGFEPINNEDITYWMPLPEPPK